MHQSLALQPSTRLIWETFGARALRRFEIRIGLDRRLRAIKRLKARGGRRGPCGAARCRCRRCRRATLAAAMFQRLIILLRDRTPFEAHA